MEKVAQIQWDLSKHQKLNSTGKSKMLSRSKREPYNFGFRVTMWKDVYLKIQYKYVCSMYKVLYARFETNK